MKRLEIRTLKKGYCDRDHILLHACFQILVDYIEQEEPRWLTEDDLKDTSCKEELETIVSQMEGEKKLQYLYDWWTNVRPKRVDPIMNDGLLSPPTFFEPVEVKGVKYSRMIDFSDNPKYREWNEVCKESNRLEVVWYEEDQKNLHRLIDVRGSLWT